MRNVLIACLWWWAVFLCFAAGRAHAQDVEALRHGVVRVSASSEGQQKTGTGFVVQRSADGVYIVTVSHVIEGDNKPRVEFFARQNVRVDAEVLKLEGGDPRGLGLLVVRAGNQIPDEARALSLASDGGVAVGDPLTAIGFPQGAGPWAVVQASVASRDGRDLALSGDIDEGNSGGPIIKGGRVVGVVTGVQGKFGRATPIAIVRVALEGWGVKLTAASTSADVRPRSEEATATALRVERIEAGSANPARYQGNCPASISFEWKLATRGGPGQIRYQIIRSDTVKTREAAVQVAGGGNRTIRFGWTLGRADSTRTYDGWVMLKLIEPQEMESEKVPFRVQCEAGASSGAAVAPPAEAGDSVSAMRVTTLSCNKIGGNTLRLILRGEMTGPVGTVTRVELEDVSYRELKRELSCGTWSKLQDKGVDCERRSADGSRSLWNLLLEMEPDPRLPREAYLHAGQLTATGIEAQQREVVKLNCR